MKRTLSMLMGTMFAMAAILVPVHAADASEPVKVVYHLTEGPEQASRALNNVRNHLDADPTAKIIAVSNGEGVQFALNGAKDKNGKEYQQSVAALVEKGVEFRVCGNTLFKRDIPSSSVAKNAKVVPTGVAEVARLQAKENFVYLRP
jgi:intracellular sulfur oxidation DsrE/DsrF family protein